MTATTLPLIPSTVVGSHGRAGWWHLGVKAWEANEMGLFLMAPETRA